MFDNNADKNVCVYNIIRYRNWIKYWKCIYRYIHVSATCVSHKSAIFSLTLSIYTTVHVAVIIIVGSDIILLLYVIAECGWMYACIVCKAKWVLVPSAQKYTYTHTHIYIRNIKSKSILVFEMNYGVDVREAKSTRHPLNTHAHAHNWHVVIVASQYALSSGLMHKCQIKRLIYDMLKACAHTHSHTAHWLAVEGEYWLVSYSFYCYTTYAICTFIIPFGHEIYCHWYRRSHFPYEANNQESTIYDILVSRTI